MNNKALFIVFIVCGLILSALVVRDGKLLLLAIPFLVYLLTGIVQAPTSMGLLVWRVIDKSSILAGESFETYLGIKNQGNVLVNLYLNDSPSSGLIIDGRTDGRFSLQPGESAQVRYVTQAVRGVYVWDTIHACVSDPFGLFELERDIPARGEILVRPLPIQIPRASLRPTVTLHATGPIPARAAGSGTDFWGVREYQAGDSLRRLNWRMASRHPRRLFTNEYEREEIADFGLILDARRMTNDESMEEALFEYSVSAAASLSENFLKRGNRVSLLIFGERIASLYPGYGKRQLNSVLKNLASARLGANLPLGYLEYFPVRLFPARSQIVIISTVDSHDLETYARLQALGYEVFLISPDPVDYATRTLPPAEINSLAIRAARVERVVQLQRLLKMGVGVIDWQVNKPLDSLMHKARAPLIHKRNI